VSSEATSSAAASPGAPLGLLNPAFHVRTHSGKINMNFLEALNLLEKLFFCTFLNIEGKNKVYFWFLFTLT